MSYCECSCHRDEARPEACIRIEPLPTLHEKDPPEPEDLCVECFSIFAAVAKRALALAEADRFRQAYLN